MGFYPMPRYLMRKHAIEKIIKKIQKDYGRKNLKLLEIGYGAGDIFNLYVSLGIEAYGYDFSEKAYQTAMLQPEVKEGKVKLFNGWDEIPINEFDIVVACEVLEHIEEDKTELEKWIKYLKINEKAAIIISVPAHQNRWDNNDIVSGHYRRYETNSLENLFRSCKLRINKLYTYDFPSNLILDPIRSRRLEENAKSDITKEQRTKNSGVEREESRLIRFLANKQFWRPIIKFQELFYNTDLGSAYILYANRLGEEKQ